MEQKTRHYISGVASLTGVIVLAIIICTTVLFRNQSKMIMLLEKAKRDTASDSAWKVDIDTIFMHKGLHTDTVKATWYRIRPDND